MKIGIDTFFCAHGHSGNGSYLLSLVKQLHASEDMQYELFGPEIDRFTYIPGGSKISYCGVNVPDKKTSIRLWHYFRINSLAAKQKYDIILYPAGIYTAPPFPRVPGVAVVNDILSEKFSHKHYFWRKIFTMKALKSCAAVIASSEFIRNDLISLGVSEKKIKIIHTGIDHSVFYPHQEFIGTSVLIKPFTIKRPFIIYASRIQNSSKKHIELIKAFSLFKEKTSLPHRLVLAGETAKGLDEIKKAVAESAYSSDIFITGYFPHEYLPELYSCADACIFPSVIEGVGLSVIEAMASGIPVACAKAGGLPEITGDAAYFFNPDNTEEAADAINAVVTDNELREKLIKKGIEWADKFSWENTVEQTLGVITQKS